MKRLGILLISAILAGCQFGETGTSDSSTEKSSEQQTEQEKATGSEQADSSESLPDKQVSFVAVGDNLIHSPIYKDAQKEENAYDFKPIYQFVEEDIQQADLAFINQETILGGVQLGLSGYPAFNTPEDMAEDLHDLGFDLVNGGTNHSLDKGTKGITNALQTWAQYPDILFTGIFDSQEKRDEVPTIEQNGITFSLLSYTYGTNGIEPQHSYLVNYFDEDQINQDIKKAKSVSDVVLISAHWGDEHAFEPNDFQKKYAQVFADAGADVVIGTHSHTIQPIEWVEGKEGNETLVAYSLGNFLAATTSNKNLLGGMLSFDVTEEEDDKVVENVHWTPTVVYYATGENNDLDKRRDFMIYPLKDYTEEIAQHHALANEDGEDVSPEYFEQLTEKMIDARYLTPAE